MILSISGVVLLGVIVFLFFRKDGLKVSRQKARIRLWMPSTSAAH